MLTEPSRYFGQLQIEVTEQNYLLTRELICLSCLISTPLSSVAKLKGYKGGFRCSLQQPSASGAHITFYQLELDPWLNNLSSQSIQFLKILMGHKNKLWEISSFFFSFRFPQHDSLEHDMLAVLLIKFVKWPVARELQPTFHTVLIWTDKITWNVNPNENKDRVTFTVLLFGILWT